VVSSIIQTVLSAPEFHWLSPVLAGVAGYNRRSGILAFGQSPCPEETFIYAIKFSAAKLVFSNSQKAKKATFVTINNSSI